MLQKFMLKSFIVFYSLGDNENLNCTPSNGQVISLPGREIRGNTPKNSEMSAVFVQFLE